MYIFQPNRELLDLNAMEMEPSLIRFFEENFGVDAELILEFINDEGLLRKLKINLREKILQGRGIKGLFAPYAEANYLFVRRLDDEKIRISTFNKPQPNWALSQIR